MKAKYISVKAEIPVNNIDKARAHRINPWSAQTESFHYVGLLPRRALLQIQKMYDTQKTMELHGWVSDLGSLIQTHAFQVSFEVLKVNFHEKHQKQIRVNMVKSQFFDPNFNKYTQGMRTPQNTVFWTRSRLKAVREIASDRVAFVNRGLTIPDGTFN